MTDVYFLAGRDFCWPGADLIAVALVIVLVGNRFSDHRTCKRACQAGGCPAASAPARSMPILKVLRYGTHRSVSAQQPAAKQVGTPPGDHGRPAKQRHAQAAPLAARSNSGHAVNPRDSKTCKQVGHHPEGDIAFDVSRSGRRRVVAIRVSRRQAGGREGMGRFPPTVRRSGPVRQSWPDTRHRQGAKATATVRSRPEPAHPRPIRRNR